MLIVADNGWNIFNQKGDIKFPKVLEPFSAQSYMTVQETLQNVGFRNVTCISMHDSKISLLPKHNKVESISINGDKITKGGKMYSPDAPIIIMYHGK